jgi:excinuclease UvrABC helicase subunit UvrB
MRPLDGGRSSRPYNDAHGITPQGIQKAIAERMAEERETELAMCSS